MRWLYAMLIPLSLCVIPLGAVAQTDAAAVGFNLSVLPAKDGYPAIDMAVWYPAYGEGTPRLVGDNAVFVGMAVAVDARPRPGRHPLAVISHGFGGNWRNQLWLAGELASQGYIVAAPNHPGTTTDNRDPALAAQLWRRPGDISRVIDAVTTRPDRFGAVAVDKIAVIGHSMGGWTALELAGARFDPGLFAQDCRLHPILASCRVYQQIAAGGSATLTQRLAMNWRDKRVGAIVTLDSGLTRGFSAASLGGITLPVLIIAAGAPSADLPAALESHALAQRLPAATTRYVEISDATHFSFMSVCKPGGADMIEREEPGEGIICRDGGTRYSGLPSDSPSGPVIRNRQIIHKQTATLIRDFLAGVWR
ncbi:alpha/beta hydrolase family protein [Sodalis sp. RH21]|uniref:alpha/beta hydrolase family protein n=1 Tax=unclassified Sodalis (in: enterobacteria) TaxID=2636512 RepID=UPI0039B507A6